ncbi:MAG: aspartyl/asparaginyl beta-hydroxylase domain-containing protein [Caulobacteraceae bacterium]|nr:aspartyl/asparaginyl beta-hydroxylase domain-containing protein [Caulobacteraceae bacterium]
MTLTDPASPSPCSRGEYPDRVRLPLGFDAARMAQDVERLEPVGWTPHFVTQNYDGDWSVIPLRAPAGARHPILMIYPDPMATVFEDAPWLARAPYLRAVLGAFGCPLQGARLMRLAPGASILEHRDHDLTLAEGKARLHIPIQTNPDARFRLNGTAVTMAPGEVWYLRLSDPHEAANAGDRERVHLVIDVLANAWLEALVERALTA